MSMYRTPVHSSNVGSIKSKFSVENFFFSFHLGSYVNLESIKIGLLVVSYFSTTFDLALDEAMKSAKMDQHPK
jgi:hypothetical protein